MKPNSFLTKQLAFQKDLWFDEIPDPQRDGDCDKPCSDGIKGLKGAIVLSRCKTLMQDSKKN